jgi:hypothetical protein
MLAKNEANKDWRYPIYSKNLKDAIIEAVCQRCDAIDVTWCYPAKKSTQ